MGSGDGGDEELTAVGVGPSIGHGEQSRLLMRELKGFILKLGSIDGLSATACLASEQGSNISMLMVVIKVSVILPRWFLLSSQVCCCGCFVPQHCLALLALIADICHQLQISKESTTHVPFLLEKSPPWIMNPLMILWNGDPLKCNGRLVPLPMPPSPVQSCRKFSAVWQRVSLLL